MKKILKNMLCAFFVVILAIGLVSCKSVLKEDELWEAATYKEDTKLGEGEKTVYVKFEMGEKTVNFTVNTDKETLGEALIDTKLITGEKGPYGLYVKRVNGVTADYDSTKSYWSFYKDGEYMQTGVDEAEISDNEHYEVVYTKAE